MRGNGISIAHSDAVYKELDPSRTSLAVHKSSLSIFFLITHCYTARWCPYLDMESNNQFDFNKVVESLKKYLRKGTEAGLQAVNDKTNGNFESKFETAFVAAIQGLNQKETKEFRKEVGSIDVVSIPGAGTSGPALNRAQLELPRRL
jgi:hypothetical protein